MALDLQPEISLDLQPEATPPKPPDYATKDVGQGPVLREQPTYLQELTNPGGIASSENLGTMAGGIAGAAMGAPFGPMGIVGGGILGAGGGAMLGRGYELALEKLLGPYNTPGTLPLVKPNRSAADVIGEIGKASEHGMMSEAIGGPGGPVQSIMKMLGGKILGPMTNKLTPRDRLSMGDAADLGYPLSPSQATNSTTLSHLEAVSGRGLMSQTRDRFINEQAKAGDRIVSDFAENISPGLSKDVADVGAVVRAAGEGRLKQLAAAATRLGKITGGDSGLDKRSAGEYAQESMRVLFDAAKEKGRKIYDAVTQAAGPAASKIEAPSFQGMAAEIAAEEAKMTGVQLPTAGVSGGILRQVPKPTLTNSQKIIASQKTGQQITDPGSLPASLIQQFGLDKPKVWDLPTIERWQSRLGALARDSTNLEAKRGYARLAAALDKDVGQWGSSLAPEAKQLLDKARGVWKTEVADIYYTDIVGKMKKANPIEMADIFLGPGSSTDKMAAVKRAIGNDAWEKVSGAHIDELMKNAVNPQTGRFSPDMALSQLGKYDDAQLKLIFGKASTAADGLVKMFQRHPTDMIESILSRDSDTLVNALIPKGANASIEPLRRLHSLLPTAQYDQFRGAVLSSINDKSRGATGDWSLDRFLTQVNSRTGYTQAQLSALLGEHYGDFRKFVNILERQKALAERSGNSSNTARGLTTLGQIAGGSALVFDIGGHMATGTEDTSSALRQIGTGAALLSPNLLSKLMFSRGGIKWLTKGFEAPRGSRAAMEAISRLSGIAASGSVGLSDTQPPPAIK